MGWLYNPTGYVLVFVVFLAWFLAVTLPSPRTDGARIRRRFDNAGERVRSIRRAGTGTIALRPLEDDPDDTSATVRVYFVEVESAEGEPDVRRVGVEAVLFRRPSVWRMPREGPPKLML